MPAFVRVVPFVLVAAFSSPLRALPGDPAETPPPDAEAVVETTDVGNPSPVEIPTPAPDANPDATPATEAGPPAAPAPAPVEVPPPTDPLVGALASMFDAVDVASRRVALAAVASRLDVRAVPAIVYVARRDADAGIRAAALDQLHWAVSPGLETAAIAILQQRGEADDVRVAAARLVAKHGSERARDALAAVSQDLDEKQVLRTRVLEQLAAIDAARAAALATRARAGDAAGRDAFTVVGALSGGYSLALVGTMAPSSLAIVGGVVGGIGGLLLGGAAAYFHVQSSPIDLGDALIVGTAGAWSVPVGTLLGSMWFGPDGTAQAPGTPATMLLVHALAMGGSIYAAHRATFTVLDAIEANALTLGGLFFGSGLMQAIRPADRRIDYAVVASAMTASFIAGAFVSDRLRLTPSTAALTVVSTIGGAVSGGLLGWALLPEATGPLGEPLFEDEIIRQQRANGLSMLGAGVGLAGLLAATVGWDPSPSDATAISFLTLAGYMVGAAVPRFGLGDGVSEAMAIGSALGGLAAGIGGGLLLGPAKLALSTGDALLIGLGTGFAAWQGIGWPSWVTMRAGGVSDPRLAAVPFSAIGLTTLALGAVSQFTDLDPMRAGWSFSGAVWGTWFGFLGSALVTAAGPDLLLSMLVASNGGLALSALALSPIVGLDPSVLVWSSLFGLGGAVAGTLGWVLFGGGSLEAFAITNLALSGVGLAAGGALGWMFGRNTPAASGAGGGAAGGWSFDPDVLPIISAAPVIKPDGATGMQGTLTWVLR